MALAASALAEEKLFSSGAITGYVSLRGGRTHRPYIRGHGVQFRRGKVGPGHAASRDTVVDHPPQFNNCEAAHAPVACEAWTAFRATRVRAVTNRTTCAENTGARRILSAPQASAPDK